MTSNLFFRSKASFYDSRPFSSNSVANLSDTEKEEGRDTNEGQQKPQSKQGSPNTEQIIIRAYRKQDFV